MFLDDRVLHADRPQGMAGDQLSGDPSFTKDCSCWHVMYQKDMLVVKQGRVQWLKLQPVRKQCAVAMAKLAIKRSLWPLVTVQCHGLDEI